MKWTIAIAKSRVEHLPEKQLQRLYRRIWEWIEKRHGSGAWDYPTMYATWPSIACYLMAILQIDTERRERGQSQ